jgi:hypothetical protein
MEGNANCFFEGLLLTYWVDDAAGEIRIVAIEWPG